MVVCGSAEEGYRDLVLMDKLREDGRKLQIILQYLESRGLSKSLAQLEDESGVSFNPNSLPSGSILDNVLDEFLAQSAEPRTGACFSPESLPAPSICATAITKTIPNIHGSSNPTCVAWNPGAENCIVSGGADRRLIIRNLETESVESELVLPSPVLCLDWSREDQLVAGCMGGEIVMIQPQRSSGDDATIVWSCKPHGHAKISSVTFSPGGEYFATCGKDISVHVFQSDERAPSHTIRCMRDVSSICWVGIDSLVVAETDNPILSVYQIESGNLVKKGELCMNLHLYDPLTAYTTLAMSFDATNGLLLACTSRNSVLLFRLPCDWDSQVTPIKTYYGMSIGVYDVPSVSFSADASFIYATSDKEVLVLETKSGHKVFSIAVSDSKPVRCMRRHPVTDLIVTVSFDKQLNLLE